MARIDTRGSATLHLTADEYGSVLERVQSLAPDSELARVLTEAEPTPAPLTEPIVETQEVNGEQMQVHVGTVTFAYAISVPPSDHELAADALRAEVDEDAATIVAEHTIPEQEATPA